jgi:hypothetical protein
LKDDLGGAFKVLRATRAGPAVFFGTIVPAFSLFSLIVALFVVPVPQLLGDLLDFYHNVTQAIFWPIASLFRIEIPQWLRDVAIFWTISGSIGAGAFIVILGEIHDLAATAVAKAEQPERRAAYIAAHGRAKYDAELEFARHEAEHKEVTPLRGIVTLVMGFITGPMIFVRIWTTRPPLGTTRLNGRHVLALYALGVLGWVVAAFGLAYVGHGP